MRLPAGWLRFSRPSVGSSPAPSNNERKSWNVRLGGWKRPTVLLLATGLALLMSACATPASGACIVYQAHRPTISEADTLETQLSVQNLDVVMEAVCE